MLRTGAKCKDQGCFFIRQIGRDHERDVRRVNQLSEQAPRGLVKKLALAGDGEQRAEGAACQ